VDVLLAPARPGEAIGGMEPTTLQFENARVLASLFANDVKLLKQAEETLGARLTTRDGWLRAEGEPEAVDRVRRLFAQLDRARQNGMNIRRGEFLYALRAVGAQEVTGLDELSDTKIQCSPRRPPVIPKTEGQARVSAGDPDARHGLRRRAGRHREDLSRDGDGGRGAQARAGHADHSHPAGGRGGRSARVFAGRFAGEDHAVSCGRFTMRCTTCSNRRKCSGMSSAG